jgi:hypothetical protein
MSNSFASSVVEIEKLILIAGNGTTASLDDITGLVLETNVYQDLFSHYISAELQISDALSLLDSIGGFTGGEILAMSFKTNSKDMEFVNHIFGVHEITNRMRVSDKVETYTLNCISIEAYYSSPQKISRSYGGSSGSTISSMASSVINEFIYNSYAKDFYRNYKSVLNKQIVKEVNIDPTNGLQKIIVPNMSPEDAIKMFLSEADSDTHIPYYLFYENSKGFNFKDLGNLVSQEPVDKFTYMQTNTNDLDDDGETVIKDYQKIISYDVLRQTDFLSNANYGLFKSRLINIDILRKNKKEFVYEYDKFQSKFNKLNSSKILGEVQGDSCVYMMHSRNDHDSDIVMSIEEPLPKKINKFINVKKSYERHIFNTVVELALPGNSNLNVGDTITVAIPNSTTLDKKKNIEDKYLSGKYVITKLRHKFGGKSQTEYVTLVECAKDTGI